MYPSELKYVDSHQWVKLDGDIGTMGITYYGQKQLGEIIFVELPPLGKAVQQKEPMAVVESSKAAYDVPSPLSGEITQTNSQLEEDPSLINHNPYGEGWMVKIRLSSPEELEGLLNAQDYQKLTGK